MLTSSWSSGTPNEPTLARWCKCIKFTPRVVAQNQPRITGGVRARPSDLLHANGSRPLSTIPWRESRLRSWVLIARTAKNPLTHFGSSVQIVSYGIKKLTDSKGRERKLEKESRRKNAKSIKKKNNNTVPIPLLSATPYGWFQTDVISHGGLCILGFLFAYFQFGLLVRPSLGYDLLFTRLRGASLG